jgi:hypothetical protein
LLSQGVTADKRIHGRLPTSQIKNLSAQSKRKPGNHIKALNRNKNQRYKKPNEKLIIRSKWLQCSSSVKVIISPLILIFKNGWQ